MPDCRHLLVGLLLAAVALAAAAGPADLARADEFGDLPRSWQGPTAPAANQPTPNADAPDFRKIMREAAPLGAAEAAEAPRAPPAGLGPDDGAAPDKDDTAAQAPALSELAAQPLQRGLAAWYQHDGVTASGEVFRPDDLTAAHRTLPLGARLRVRSEKTGKEVTVRVNDRVSRKALQRRPLAIELSRASAEAIGLDGVGQVAIYRAD